MSKKLISTIENNNIYLNDDGSIEFTAKADIDADGSPWAYNPDNTGLDYNGNAKDGDKWVGILTDQNGKPIIQSPTDPAPGYYISTTSYQNIQFPVDNPNRYIDSSSIPFFVVPPIIISSVKPKVLGSKAQITYNDITIDAVVADIGPHSKLGELSIAAAKALGIPSSPKTGGVDKGVFYKLWPGETAVVSTIDVTNPIAIEPELTESNTIPIPIPVTNTKVTFLDQVWKWIKNH